MLSASPAPVREGGGSSGPGDEVAVGRPPPELFVVGIAVALLLLVAGYADRSSHPDEKTDRSAINSRARFAGALGVL